MGASRVESWKALFTNLLKLDELSKNYQFLTHILPEPTNRTMDIVEKRTVGAVNPFQFMAFGLSIIALTQLSSSIFSPELAFLDGFVILLVLILFIVIFYSIAYMIFQDVAKTSRTFDDFLELCAITAGMSWILTGVPVLILAMNEILGAMLYLAATIYMFVYTMNVWKRFWNMSYGKILLYMFFSTIASGIVGFIVIFIIGLVFSPYIPD
jgi:hypothetical protein